ncbi:hypothetical protein [Acidimangrovimonas sediminis]|uniref:hypothetical protein n=1 Tax=Acidimangrovimonas sediminis TaxID=2056283 RepID=UPI0011AF3C8F|nr:hypothetical protein [Acidimangrovimonas sediminis]
MKIMILERPGDEVAEISDRLSGLGHDVRHIPAVGRAMNLARVDPPDLLISALFPESEGVGGESGLSVAMAAQFHNPSLVTILLSDSLIFSQGELFSMLGSLRCVMRRPAKVDDLIEISEHFLGHGPVNCAPSANGPDICGHCLLTDICTRAARARAAAGEGREASRRESNAA